jgi:multidrug efflux pump subunit AcrA (membrane-fusion protein)
VIDTMQHTAIIKGWLDNPDGQLRVGQFVTATVDLPNRQGLVVVPISSLIDDGSRTYVFVAGDKEKTSFTRREVKIARRGAVMAQLESQPKPDDTGASHPRAIEAGELVVASGVMELANQFHVLETQRSTVAVETSGVEAGSRP